MKKKKAAALAAATAAAESGVRAVELPRRVAILSFEGPDRYASIGGLGTRVTQMANALDAIGCVVDLIFVGDPASAPVETRGNLTLRRWSQWISAQHPRNAYDGEMEKIADWESSLPGFVVDQIVAPTTASDERTLIICEEWQTAGVAIAIDRLARLRGVRNTFTLIWNANNTYGWEHVDFAALRDAAAITAVSKYMKFELARHGVPSLVIPNGIENRLLSGADPKLLAEMKQALAGRPTLVKVGRFDPDKNWLQAVDALAELHASGINARMIVRGGRDPYADVVFARAHERGLNVERIGYEGSDGHKVIDGIALAEGPIIHLRAFLDDATLYALYAAADAVLANSGKEPFGLVGLEVMAAGGIAVCGATGEEYAEPFVNAIVCDTSDGRELATYLRALFADPGIADDMRRAGSETVGRYTWGHALAALERKIGYIDAVMA
jgi:glycosyltransferase involved in cell wall biosynthesis